MHKRKSHFVAFGQPCVASYIGCIEILSGKRHPCIFSTTLQPLDVAVFGPFKTAANQLCYDWVQSHPGRVMQISDLPPIFARALTIGAHEENILSSFRATGIWPYDTQVFKDIDFMPSETTDREYTPDELVDENEIPVAGNVELAQNQSQHNFELDDGDSFDFSLSLDSPLSTSTSVQDLTQTLKIIRPFPRAPSRQEGIRGLKRQKTAILTSDETFNEIETEQEARDAKKKATEARKVAATGKKKKHCCKKTRNCK